MKSFLPPQREKSFSVQRKISKKLSKIVNFYFKRKLISLLKIMKLSLHCAVDFLAFNDVLIITEDILRPQSLCINERYFFPLPTH